MASKKVTFREMPCTTARFRLPRGVRPGTGEVTIASSVYKEVKADDCTGDLLFETDVGSVTLKDLRVVHVEQPKADKYVVTLQLADRRVMWVGMRHAIGGPYNVWKDDNFDPKTITTLGDSPVPWTLKQLCQKLFQFLNVKEEEVTYYPDAEIVFPININWDWAEPGSALQDMLTSVGFDLSLKTDGTFTVDPVGSGVIPTVPDNRLHKEKTADDVSVKPDYIVVAGPRMREETTFECLAVGLELDSYIAAHSGTPKIRPISDLSYKPAGGWEQSVLLKEPFADVASDDARALAKQCVYKWFRPEVNATFEKSLPWLTSRSTLISIMRDINGTPTRVQEHDKECVYGQSFRKTGGKGHAYQNVASERLSDGYSIDRALGLVKFSRPMGRLVNPDVSVLEQTTLQDPSVTISVGYEKKDAAFETNNYFFTIVRVSDGTVVTEGVSWLLDKNHKIIKDQSLVLYRIAGADQNGTALRAKGLQIAKDYIKTLARVKSQEIVAAGPMDCSPNGSVLEVSFEATPRCLTTLRTSDQLSGGRGRRAHRSTEIAYDAKTGRYFGEVAAIVAALGAGGAARPDEGITPDAATSDQISTEGVVNKNHGAVVVLRDSGSGDNQEDTTFAEVTATDATTGKHTIGNIAAPAATGAIQIKTDGTKAWHWSGILLKITGGSNPYDGIPVVCDGTPIADAATISARCISESLGAGGVAAGTIVELLVDRAGAPCFRYGVSAIIEASGWAYISSASPSSNYNGYSWIYHSRYYDAYQESCDTLVKFTPAQARTGLLTFLTDGDLSLQMNFGGGAPDFGAVYTIHAYPILTDWDPATVTWATCPTIGTSICTGPAFSIYGHDSLAATRSESPNWYSWYVNYPNPCYGFLLRLLKTSGYNLNYVVNQLVELQRRTSGQIIRLLQWP